MKLKIFLCVLFICIGSTLFAQTVVYNNDIYGPMTLTFSQGTVYAVQGNMAVTFYYKSYICGILNYYNQNYGTLLIASHCMSYVMPNGQTVMFYPSSANTYSPSGGSYSSPKSSSYELCYTCHGTGRCEVCKGSGIYSNYGHSSTCSACEGTGKCWHCYGSGKQ